LETNLHGDRKVVSKIWREEELSLLLQRDGTCGGERCEAEN
jgi:hypothetical protein